MHDHLVRHDTRQVLRALDGARHHVDFARAGEVGGNRLRAAADRGAHVRAGVGAHEVFRGIDDHEALRLDAKAVDDRLRPLLHIVAGHEPAAFAARHHVGIEVRLLGRLCLDAQGGAAGCERFDAVRVGLELLVELALDQRERRPELLRVQHRAHAGALAHEVPGELAQVRVEEVLAAIGLRLRHRQGELALAPALHLHRAVRGLQERLLSGPQELHRAVRRYLDGRVLDRLVQLERAGHHDPLAHVPAVVGEMHDLAGLPGRVAGQEVARHDDALFARDRLPVIEHLLNRGAGERVTAARRYLDLARGLPVAVERELGEGYLRLPRAIGQRDLRHPGAQGGGHLHALLAADISDDAVHRGAVLHLELVGAADVNRLRQLLPALRYPVQGPQAPLAHRLLGLVLQHLHFFGRAVLVVVAHGLLDQAARILPPLRGQARQVRGLGHPAHLLAELLAHLGRGKGLAHPLHVGDFGIGARGERAVARLALGERQALDQLRIECEGFRFERVLAHRIRLRQAFLVAGLDQVVQLLLFCDGEHGDTARHLARRLVGVIAAGAGGIQGFAQLLVHLG